MRWTIPIGLVLIVAGVGVVMDRAPDSGPGSSTPSDLRSLLVDGAVWPPVVGERYPDLVLMDRTGGFVPFTWLEGQVILVEPIGMSCPACQAFAGAHEAGSLGGVKPQPGLPSIADRLPDDARLVRVHLLLYDLKMGVPSTEDIASWADRFAARDGEIVLAGAAPLQGKAS